MLPRIAFCARCRGMKVGWNRRYVLHRLLCRRWLRQPARLGSLAIVTAALILAFPKPGASVFSSDRPEKPAPQLRFEASVVSVGAAARSTDTFLKRHGVLEANRGRLAESIETSARKYDLNPRLIASIVVVESRGNPFAISGKDAIGIMQIHLPTWGTIAVREGINLFKIEDNIDFGARILKNYVRQFGVWEGVKRYNGFIADDPISQQSADEYVAKVQRTYEFQHPAAPENVLD